MTHFLSILPALLAMGLAGGLHCAGMCGGLAILATGTGRTAKAWAAALYLGGKTSTYVFLGTLAGALGETVATAASLGIGSRILALAGGLLLVAVGLESVGLVRLPFWRAGWMRRASDLLASLAASGPAGSLLMGAANGLLPCPMVYGFLGLAASTGSTIGGAATMAVLGLTSAVPLVICAALGHRVGRLSGARVAMLAGLLMIAVGGLMLYRGMVAGTGAHHHPAHVR